jgi:TetR/AcrR family transcriptional regulator, tetracycline repressor protein
MSSRRDEVLVAALGLLDDVGLDAITIRKLAERIGVQPGALYRHFTSKRELLDAMVERIAAEAPAAEMTGDWAAQVRSIAGAARAGMLTHRDGARLMSTFFQPGPAAITAWQRFIGLFTGAGLDEAAAVVAVDTVLCYVNGFTIEEQARGSRSGAEKDAAFQAGLDLIIAGVEAGLANVRPLAGRPTGP